MVAAARLVDATDTTDESDWALLLDSALALALELAADADDDPVEDSEEDDVLPVMVAIAADAEDAIEAATLSGAVAVPKTLSNSADRLPRNWRSSTSTGSGAAVTGKHIGTRTKR